MTADTILATTRNGLAHAKRGRDRNWSVEFPLSGQDVRCLVADPLRPDTIYVGTQGSGILTSKDRGKTWRPAGLPGLIIKSIAVSQVKPGTIYAGTKPPQIFVAHDSGATWTELTSFRKIPSRSLWFSPAESPGTAYVQAIALSPIDPKIIIAGIEFGAVVRSVDGGESWTDHRKGALRDCHSLTFHNTKGDWVYEGGGTGAGVALSRDAGASWIQPEEGLDRHYGWAVAADPV